MDKFWEYLEKSVLVQASVTLILVLTTCYLWLNKMPVPDLLVALISLVMGFWFGTKTQQMAHKKTGGEK